MQLGKTIHRKLREEFLKYKLPQLKESYRDDYRHYLELEPFKAIEDKMVCEIKLGDLERVRNAIAVKHAKSGVHRAVTQSKRMLSWAWSFQAAFSGLEDVQYEWWLRWKFEYKTNERTRCPSIEEIARTLVIAERFRHLADGEHETYPSLTGITDEFVAGHRIEASAVEFFVQDSVIVIAHNAPFDRKFAERFWPVFERKAWGCSATEVEWRRHGFEGSRLCYLLSGAGFFRQPHRAVDDCHALLEILALELPTVGMPALALLLEQARRKTIRVWAEQSPFDLKDALKRRGYRWSDRSDGRPRSWYIDVSETDVDVEIAFLKSEIYLGEITPRLQTLTAFTRFSART